jgi:hypothetical protein
VPAWGTQKGTHLEPRFRAVWLLWDLRTALPPAQRFLTGFVGMLCCAAGPAVPSPASSRSISRNWPRPASSAGPCCCVWTLFHCSTRVAADRPLTPGNQGPDPPSGRSLRCRLEDNSDAKWDDWPGASFVRKLGAHAKLDLLTQRSVRTVSHHQHIHPDRFLIDRDGKPLGGAGDSVRIGVRCRVHIRSGS